MRASTTQRWLTEGGSDARGGVYSGERRWPTASLAEACEKITDGTHRSPPNGGHGVPYITAKNIRRFEIDLTELTYVSEEHHREIYSRCDPRLGDVLYIKDGATMGIAAINTLNYEFSLLSSVALLRPRADLLRADYLTYWLNHPDTYRRVRETQAGSAIQRMVLDQIRNMSIPLPPLSEQERIGAWLTRALGAVTVARKAASDRLAAAEALSPALFRESFGGTPTFDASPLMPSVPAQPGWMWHRLTSLARLATGHTPSRRRPDYWVGNIPWIQLPDIRALDGRTAMDTSEHTNALGVENSAAVLLPSGTVCLSRTASVGFVTILGREMATSQDFVNWVCGPELDPQFLMLLLIAGRTSIRALGSGSVHHSIYFPTVEQFSVCVPPVAQQRRAATRLFSRLVAAEAAVTRCREELSAIESLPATLLRAAFNGAH